MLFTTTGTTLHLLAEEVVLGKVGLYFLTDLSLRNPCLHDTKWRVRNTSSKHSLFEGMFGFLQSYFSSFRDTLCPFNVDDAARVGILYPDLMVLLAPPGTKLLAQV